MATLKDVAQKAGVSIATVSYILNGRKKLSDKIEKKVKEAAKNLNYYPNTAAQTLRKGQSSNIALIIPDLSNPWFSELAHHITVEAQSLNLSVTIFTTLYNDKIEAQILDKVEKLGMIACLIIPIGNKIDDNYRTPFLLLDREVDNLACISFDNYNGGILQAQHALEQSPKHILILCDPKISSSSHQRLKGIESILQGKVSYKIIHQDFANKLIQEAAHYIKSNQIDTIICAADIIASAVIRLAAENNIRIPQDISLISFDDVYYASVMQPPLTTIKQDAKLLAHQALLEVAHHINNPKQQINFKTQKLPVSLIIRESTNR